MNLIDFIKMASGLDEKRLPKSTATICLVELEENEDKEIVSNIKDMVTLLTPEIKIDYFADGLDENGYIEVNLCFGNATSNELKAAWDILEQYKKLNTLDDVPIDTDIEIFSDTMVELMIMPKETAEADPIFFELAFPINFTLCSSIPGRIADSINLFFNSNSCIFHENNYVDMEDVERESDEYVNALESEYRQEQEAEEERLRKEKENIQRQMESMNKALDQPESIQRIRIGGKSDEDEDL
jgi:hypothetical protein